MVVIFTSNPWRLLRWECNFLRRVHSTPRNSIKPQLYYFCTLLFPILSFFFLNFLPNICPQFFPLFIALSYWKFPREKLSAFFSLLLRDERNMALRSWLDTEQFEIREQIFIWSVLALKVPISWKQGWTEGGKGEKPLDIFPVEEIRHSWYL